LLKNKLLEKSEFSFEKTKKINVYNLNNKSMKKLFFLSILCLTIISCNKEDDIPDQQENFVKLETNTIEIEPSVPVTNITENTITFNTSNNNLKSLKAGDVIVSGSTTDTPNGYARKIISVQNNGNEVKLETVQAKINEVYE
jgi:hypothetical protein